MQEFTSDIHPLDCATDDDLWIIFHEFHVPNQSLRKRDVIGVPNGDIFPLRVKATRISSFSQTTMRYPCSLIRLSLAA
jgi:hypothetical protein